MFACLSLQAQNLHVTVTINNDTSNIVTLWNANKPAPDITSLYPAFKNYNVAFYSADSTFYIGEDALFTVKRQIQSGIPVFLGGYAAINQKNLWLSKLNTDTNSITISIDVWEK